MEEWRGEEEEVLTCSLTSRGRCLTRRARPWWNSRWTCRRLRCAVWPLSTICQQSSGFKPPTTPPAVDEDEQDDDDIRPLLLLLLLQSKEDDEDDATTCWTCAVHTGTGLSLPLPPPAATAAAKASGVEWVAPAAVAIICQIFACWGFNNSRPQQKRRKVFVCVSDTTRRHLNHAAMQNEKKNEMKCQISSMTRPNNKKKVATKQQQQQQQLLYSDKMRLLITWLDWNWVFN